MLLLVGLRSIKGTHETITFGLCDGKYQHNRMALSMSRRAMCHHPSTRGFQKTPVFRKYHLVNKSAIHMLQNYSRKCLWQWYSWGNVFTCIQCLKMHTALSWRLLFKPPVLFPLAHSVPTATKTQRQMRSRGSQKGEWWCFSSWGLGLPW